MPLVSIIIPCFNSKKYIKEAVDSALAQSYENIEIIIVDDGSTDGSYELLLEEYSKINKVKILIHNNRENKGVSSSRKLAIANAKGEYLAFLDADDIFLPHKINCQLDVFRENKNIVLVHSRALCKSEINNQEFHNEFQYSQADLCYEIKLKKFLKSNHICNSSVMVKKTVFDQVDIPTNLLYQYEDWLHWILLSRFGKFYYQNDPTCTYRYHTESATSKIVKKETLHLYANLEAMMVLFNIHQRTGLLPDINKQLVKSINQIYANYSKKSKLSFGFYLRGLIDSLF